MLCEQSACEKKILAEYPEAECTTENDKETCRTVCESKGEKKCKALN